MLPVATASTDAQAWWKALIGAAVVRDDVGVPGSGLVCFGSFGFTDDDPSELVVPEVIVGRRGGTTWVTTISPASSLAAPPELVRYEPDPVGEVAFADGARSGTAWSGDRRRRGDPDHRWRARQGGAGPRPDRHGRPADRPALAVAPARGGVPELLDVLRRRPDRRDPGAAGPPGEGPDHLPGAGRHHPAYRGRRARPRTGRVAGPVQQGLGGARVRGPLGGRRAEAALQVDERARRPRSCCTCRT